MTDEKFKEVIYKPYLDTWKVLKLLQHAYKRLDDPELDKPTMQSGNSSRGKQ